MDDRETKFSFLNKLRNQLVKLDAYPKTLEDFRIKTFGGGTVTIISLTLIAILFLLELNRYLTPTVHEELLVDISSGKKLNIHIDIVFPHVVCSHLSLDATDVSGEQHINIQHTIYKRRLNEHGDPIELPQKDNTIVTKKSSKFISGQMESITNQTKDLDPNRCESCYGVDSSIKKCCNSCKDVREAYNAMGWVFDPANVEQCKREGITRINNSTEGCQIFGTIEVNKVAGNFHIALGQSFERHHAHVHDINLNDMLSMNTSHKINHLSFGDKIEKIVNQLDDTWFISDQGNGLSTFQYFIKIVPTIYQNLGGKKIETNQFAVTRFKKEFGSAFEALTDARLPGVFFIYEFGPMLVKYTEKRQSTVEFLTSLCAIIGGILTVAGVIDSFMYHSYRALRAKIQLGKLG